MTARPRAEQGRDRCSTGAACVWTRAGQGAPCPRGQHRGSSCLAGSGLCPHVLSCSHRLLAHRRVLKAQSSDISLYMFISGSSVAGLSGRYPWFPCLPGPMGRSDTVTSGQAAGPAEPRRGRESPGPIHALRVWHIVYLTWPRARLCLGFLLCQFSP